MLFSLRSGLMVLFLLTFSLLLGACTSQQEDCPEFFVIRRRLNVRAMAAVTILESIEPVLIETPIPEVTTVWVAPYVPSDVQEAADIPAEYQRVDSPEGASLRLEVGDQRFIGSWVYAVVVPFPTIPDGITSLDLELAWKGQSAGPLGGWSLLIDENTFGVISALWGEPAEGLATVVAADVLLEQAWARLQVWSIVPFSAIEPRWKVLEVDGSSPIRNDFNPEAYALSVPFSLNGETNAEDELLIYEGDAESEFPVPPLNYDPEKLTTLVMTGVTAMVRATAFTMEREGLTYPARDIGSWLRNADLTHINNVVSFAPDCPFPDPTDQFQRFCSNPDYIALLEDIGTDIVEVTGHRIADWGLEALRYTLDLYQDLGWVYYGGGYNIEDAKQARYLEHNGNRVAFIGCNAKGGGYATVNEFNPGATACDQDWMISEIARLKADGYIVIITFQHEEDYAVVPKPVLVEDFAVVAQAGADIVSGSQAHTPHAMAFANGAFIHYGLGNLFFDQYNYCTEQVCNYTMIDRHVFYDGYYIGTELLTAQFEDYARSRPMSPSERDELLTKVFEASGW